MSEKMTCPQCGATLAAYALAGLCPRCLMGIAFENDPRVPPDQPTSSPRPTDRPQSPSRFIPPAAADLAARFPQLENLELVGFGGMGAVYKARQANLDRVIALKIMRPEGAHDSAFTERFNREAKALARLSHQHIVTIYDFGVVQFSSGADAPAAPLFYFLMEYVDGANLRQLLQASSLTPEQALAIVPQICDALQYAHDSGVVHRDIKPENILIDKRGRVKITDFGLAKMASHSGDEISLTATHQVMGTLRYMAPEQMEGSHAVDHRADIYSLGVVFYEMLTGEAPAGHFDPPSRKVEIDVRLDEVVLRSLAREPERRYQQASDVKTDLQSLFHLPLPVKQQHEAKKPVLDRTSNEIDRVAASSSPTALSMLRQAWDDWWAKRDRWLTRVVQSVLLLLFLFCEVLFFSYRVTQVAGAKREGRTIKRTIVMIGAPTPWFQFDHNPDARTFHAFKVNYFTSSVGFGLFGFLFYAASWQIEKALATAAGKQLRWWHGSPNFVLIAWAAMVFFAVLLGMQPLYLNASS